MRKRARNIAPTGTEFRLPPYTVLLAGYGNPDFGQDPNEKVSETVQLLVGSIPRGSAMVRDYISHFNLGAGNWVKGAGEVIDSENQYVGRFSYNGRFWPLDHPGGHGAPHQLAMGGDLSKRGMKAYMIIMTILTRHGLADTGGCRPFYSPEEWAARGEKYCKNADLYIVHDGGSLSAVFGDFVEPFYGEISKALKKHKLYVEGCTGWYSAVYPIVPLKIKK